MSKESFSAAPQASKAGEEKISEDKGCAPESAHVRQNTLSMLLNEIEQRHELAVGRGDIRIVRSADDVPKLVKLIKKSLEAQYLFTSHQMYEVLDSVLGMFFEYRDVHGKDEGESKRLAVVEIIDGLDAERDLVESGERIGKLCQVILSRDILAKVRLAPASAEITEKG